MNKALAFGLPVPVPAALLISLAAGCVPADERVSAPAQPAWATFARLGEEVRVGGVRVRPLRVVEDSRCPLSVQCVQAGTVRLAVRLGTGGAARETVLRLREPEPLGGGRILWLVGACPFPRDAGPPLEAAAYRFQLAAGRAGEPVPPTPLCAAA